MPKRLIQYLLLAMVFIAGYAHSITADQVKTITIGDGDARIEALRAAIAGADERFAYFLQALNDDAVKVVNGKPVIVQDGKGFDAVTGVAVVVPDTAEDVMNNNRMRGEIESALAALKLLSPDAAVRREAVKALQGQVDESKMPLIDKAFAKEQVSDIQAQMGLLRASAMLDSADKAKRLEAATVLSDSSLAATKTLLLDRLQTEQDTDVKSALRNSLAKVESRLAWGDRLGAIFSGISLGSILLLVALG
ncbi:MAG: urea transporter permease subunit UrtB, partial [Pseudomonadota bacterium]